jgi:hypothetical protein
MIEFDLLRDRSILVVRPKGPLEAADFSDLARTVDPYLDSQGSLKGLLIEAPSFPGWSDFAGLIGHLRFVRDHHRRIRRVAAVTDSTVLSILPKIAEHFAQPEIRVFTVARRAEAMAWLETATPQ